MNWIAFREVTSSGYSKHPIQVGLEALGHCHGETHI